MQEIIRHGDILLKPCDKIPSTAKNLNTKTLALGEVTGHHHTMTGNAQVYQDQDENKTKYVRVNQKSQLTHQEHKTVPLEKGSYVLVNEQEFDPFQDQIRRVRD